MVELWSLAASGAFTMAVGAIVGGVLSLITKGQDKGMAFYGLALAGLAIGVIAELGGVSMAEAIMGPMSLDPHPFG